MRCAPWHIAWAVLGTFLGITVTIGFAGGDWYHGTASVATYAKSNTAQNMMMKCGLIGYCIDVEGATGASFDGVSDFCSKRYGESFSDNPIKLWRYAAGFGLVSVLGAWFTAVCSVATMFFWRDSVVWIRNVAPLTTLFLLSAMISFGMGVPETAEGVGTDTLCRMCGPGNDCSIGVSCSLMIFSTVLACAWTFSAYKVPFNKDAVEPFRADG